MKPFSESLRYEFPFDSSARILDVGCFEGNWSREMWKRYGCEIVAMEPVRDFYWNCIRRLRGTGVVVVPFGLGGEARTSVFRVAGDSSGQFGNWLGVNPEVVELITPFDLMNELAWDWASLLKLNCEGSEYEILEHCIERGMLGWFKNIHVQFHTNAPNHERRYEMIARELSKTHVCEFREPFIWEGWRRIQP